MDSYIGSLPVCQSDPHHCLEAETTLNGASKRPPFSLVPTIRVPPIDLPSPATLSLQQQQQPRYRAGDPPSGPADLQTTWPYRTPTRYLGMYLHLLYLQPATSSLDFCKHHLPPCCTIHPSPHQRHPLKLKRSRITHCHGPHSHSPRDISLSTSALKTANNLCHHPTGSPTQQAVVPARAHPYRFPITVAMASKPSLSMFTRGLSSLSQSSDPNSPNVNSPAEQRADSKLGFLKAMRPLPTQHYWNVYFDR